VRHGSGWLPIPEGATLFLLWAAANYDRSAIDAPEQIRLDRERMRQHMGFGHGVHHCAGAQLSYEELAFLLEDSASFQAFARLPLAWTPRKSGLYKTISAITAETREA